METQGIYSKLRHDIRTNTAFIFLSDSRVCVCASVCLVRLVAMIGTEQTKIPLITDREEVNALGEGCPSNEVGGIMVESMV